MRSPGRETTSAADTETERAPPGRGLRRRVSVEPVRERGKGPHHSSGLRTGRDVSSFFGVGYLRLPSTVLDRTSLDSSPTTDSVRPPPTTSEGLRFRRVSSVPESINGTATVTRLLLLSLHSLPRSWTAPSGPTGTLLSKTTRTQSKTSTRDLRFEDLPGSTSQGTFRGPRTILGPTWVVRQHINPRYLRFSYGTEWSLGVPVSASSFRVPRPLCLFGHRDTPLGAAPPESIRPRRGFDLDPPSPV